MYRFFKCNKLTVKMNNNTYHEKKRSNNYKCETKP